MYFVVKDGLNYSDTKAQNLVCGGQYCNSDSVSTQIFVASKQPNRYIIISSEIIGRRRSRGDIKMS